MEQKLEILNSMTIEEKTILAKHYGMSVLEFVKLIEEVNKKCGR